MRARHTIALAAVALTAGALGSVPSAEAAKAPRLTKALRCVPVTSPACRTAARVEIGRQVQVRGSGLRSGMRVTFRWSAGALATKLRRSSAGYSARVPAGTRAGRVSVTVSDRAGRRSNARRLLVAAPAGPRRPVRVEGGALPEAFRGNGMWIWVVDRTENGNVAAIINRAKASGFRTLYVKSADGARRWTQFTPQLVQTLKAAGFRVCGWQFAYGADPAGEARAALAAKDAGADCFVVDAESAYKNRYTAAQRYMTALRVGFGADYPIGFTSFPYVDYHATLPYSVFLGPSGAQANLPQVYWKDIGAKVDAVSARTVAQNRIYAAPVAPLGQAYSGPAPGDLTRFRAIWAGYGSQGVSWWAWQNSTPLVFQTLSLADPAPVASPDPGWPALDKGTTGDQVIRMQQHLASANGAVKVDGRFTAATQAALRAFQTARGLEATGETDAATWRALVTLPVTPADWSAGSPRY